VIPQALSAAWICWVWAESPKIPPPLRAPDGRVNPPEGRLNPPDGRVNDPDGRVNDPDGRAGSVMPAALRQVVTAGLLNSACPPWPPRPAPGAADEVGELDVGVAEVAEVLVDEPPPQAASTPANASRLATAPAFRVDVFIGKAFRDSMLRYSKASY
jgi:hypothetical protein